MTEQELQAIKERVAAATPGEWVHKENYLLGVSTEDERGDIADCWGENAKNDACFIAHARQDIPALIAEIERISRNQLYVLDENRRLREALKFYADKSNHKQSLDYITGEGQSVYKRSIIMQDNGEIARKALEVQR